MDSFEVPVPCPHGKDEQEYCAECEKITKRSSELATLIQQAEKSELRSEDLDELVHETADALAASANNAGLCSQLEFLREQLGFEETSRLLRREPMPVQNEANRDAAPSSKYFVVRCPNCDNQLGRKDVIPGIAVIQGLNTGGYIEWEGGTAVDWDGQRPASDPPGYQCVGCGREFTEDQLFSLMGRDRWAKIRNQGQMWSSLAEDEASNSGAPVDSSTPSAQAAPRPEPVQPDEDNDEDLAPVEPIEDRELCLFDWCRQHRLKLFLRYVGTGYRAGAWHACLKGMIAHDGTSWSDPAGMGETPGAAFRALAVAMRGYTLISAGRPVTAPPRLVYRGPEFEISVSFGPDQPSGNSSVGRGR